MLLTKQQHKEFSKTVEPAMKWLHKNCHPHCSIIMDSLNAELLEGLASATSETKGGQFEAVVILQRADIEKIAQIVCDIENQPHQYTGDIEGFTELLKEQIAKNCLADFNDAIIEILPEDFDSKKVNEVYNRLLSALSK